MTRDRKTQPEGTGPAISRRELLKRLSPLGKVTLDAAACTGCGLCACECLTGALAIIAGADDAFQLLFKHGACTACNLCVAICPEHCLHLERTLEMDAVDKPVVLLEDRLIRCTGCGKPVGPGAMIARLQARLLAAGQPASQFELCPACKARARFNYSDLEISRPARK